MLRDPSFSPRQGLIWPHYTSFSVGAASQGVKPRAPGIFEQARQARSPSAEQLQAGGRICAEARVLEEEPCFPVGLPAGWRKVVRSGF